MTPRHAFELITMSPHQKPTHPVRPQEAMGTDEEDDAQVSVAQRAGLCCRAPTQIARCMAARVPASRASSTRRGGSTRKP
eukprot:9438171-Heterocapsa_arctica.AAC.1